MKHPLGAAERSAPGALAAVEEIEGVHAAWLRIDPRDAGAVGEMVLAVELGAEPDRVRDEALEALAARGLRLDPAALRIAVLEGQGELPEAAPSRWTRPLVRHDLQILRGDRRATCCVELRHDGLVVAAEASDLDSGTGRARAAARATLGAAEEAYPGCSLGLQGLRLIDLGGRPHIALTVEAVSERRSARLAALAAVDPSPEEAACLAALGAIERWLSA
ncbi:MAG: hypothetical protein ABFS34_14250 [Gemmatimonadota bacterium]